ncbi:MAG: metallophosphoesterase [Bacteroidetes bacterium]|nr:metallophosphoesterase [Bacteroidota bacterium]MCB0844800.1 metallophosphoesterase [Bacteroidota bacterium]
MNKLIVIPIFALILLIIDYYVFQGIKAASQSFAPTTRNLINYIYWGITVLTMVSLFAYHFVNPFWLGKNIRTAIMVGIFTNYVSKIVMVFFLFIDEIWRLIQWVIQQFKGPEPATEVAENAIPRSEFLAKTGVILGTAPIVAISWGIISGAHDYRVRRKTLHLPNLPKSFDGIRIAQISDVHSGSFWNKTAVKGGIDMLNKEKPDLVFFTGDLVNNQAEEMKDYVDVFDKVTAPLGVYSILGNHDYGDYVSWPSKAAKAKNLETLIQTHRAMGWDILLDEHRILKEGDGEIAIIGIENWGAKGRFPKYGNLKNAYQGTEDVPVKLLLSHDPSHWRAEVLPMYPDIDLTFSGHTHGMQFGVEIGDFRWSPVKYMYDEWADLYQSGKQYLYVNRGFGYLGFPGRIGIVPEITVIELKRDLPF